MNVNTIIIHFKELFDAASRTEMYKLLMNFSTTRL
jgi:hypothetical protein